MKGQPEEKIVSVIEGYGAHPAWNACMLSRTSYRENEIRY